MESNWRAYEVQLLKWKKSTSTSPPTITFALQADDDMEFFETLTLKKGKIAGQLMEIGVRLSEQDDQKKQGHDIPKEKPLSVQAALMCKEPKFWEWVEGATSGETSPTNEAEARAFLLEACKISSRAELDKKPYTASAYCFNVNIQTPFRKWVNERKVY